MTDTNPRESLDAEGIPDSDFPPGRDIETEEETIMAPRDHPIAAGGDPAYAVTAAEERARESVAERADRELPDFGEPGGPGAGADD
ncbi:MAG: hypothetical protein M3P85_12855 [Actinomycetota bacterium]|jgi:hypothetical protein|nr:hypothetical protein [Actinomycetota bacterium]PLS76264.1 MAG: hypothetical protein CYG61_03045 [Actinomycetota bacterium]